MTYMSICDGKVLFCSDGRAPKEGIENRYLMKRDKHNESKTSIGH